MISFLVVLAASAVPVRLQAEGISLLTDFEYFSTREESTDKETGAMTDSNLSRLSQLYKLDMDRYLYPNVHTNLGGYFEHDDTHIEVRTIPLPETTVENKKKSIRPYGGINLSNPLYKGGVSYRKRITESSGTFRTDETLMIDEYNANLNWRPIEFPLMNVHWQHIDVENDPLTLDATRESLNLLSKYNYNDYGFRYSYYRSDNTDHLEKAGTLSSNHNAGVNFSRNFVYNEDRYDVRASVKYIYNTIDFTGANAAAAIVDTPAANPGGSFYIPDDPFPEDNVDEEIILGPLTEADLNLGLNGLSTDFSQGLRFNAPTEVDVLYIQLSDDTTSSDVNQLLADPSFDTQVYISDDLPDQNPSWTPQQSSLEYNRIDNRFEIRLAAPVSTQLIKITISPPLTSQALGEIRIIDISAFTTEAGDSGKEPENFDQYYSFGLQWIPSPDTRLGYDVFYTHRDSRHAGSHSSSLTNGVYFRHTITPVYSTNGRYSINHRREQSINSQEHYTEQLYSLALKAVYLDTLNQVLTYSGAHSRSPDATLTNNFIILRTGADLYTGWSTNLDLGYGYNFLEDGSEQAIRNIRAGTIVEPNRNINLSMDYNISWIEQTDKPDSMRSFGTAQLLWSLTDTVNTFFRYSFRKTEATTTRTTYEREYNINWAPFPGGTLQFSIGYTEETRSTDRKIKTISPSMTWKIARGILFDLRYSNGSLDSSTQRSDVENIITKLRIFY